MTLQVTTTSLTMKRFRGFKLGRKIVKVFKWIIRSRRKPARRHLLLRYNPVSKILSLARHLRRGAKQLCFPSLDPGYIKLGQTQTRPAKVPKGHLVVYVGESDGDTKRVLVPVICFNHPLFAELLKEAEKVYGYNQPGGLTIPCGFSEFEKVQTRIAEWNHRGRRRKHRPHW